jgi:hypothetical protein
LQKERKKEEEEEEKGVPQNLVVVHYYTLLEKTATSAFCRFIHTHYTISPANLVINIHGPSPSCTIHIIIIIIIY